MGGLEARFGVRVHSLFWESRFGEENYVAVELWARYKFVAFLSLGGLLSAIVTAGLRYSFGLLGVYVLGGVFGADMGIALALSGKLQGIWKAALLPVPAAIA